MIILVSTDLKLHLLIVIAREKIPSSTDGVGGGGGGETERKYLAKLILPLVQFVLLSGNIEKRLDFGKQSPPGPVPQLHVASPISLDNSDCGQLLNSPLVVSPCNVSSRISLEDCDDLGQFNVSLFLQMGENASPEEDLRLSDSVAIWVEFHCLHLKEGTKLFK